MNGPARLQQLEDAFRISTMFSSWSRLARGVAFCAALLLFPGTALAQPSTPVGLNAADSDADSGASIRLTWDNPNDASIDHYKYRLSTDDGITWDPDWTVIAYSNDDTTSFLLTGLTYGISYTIQLSAVDGNNTASELPAEETFTPLLPAPSNLKANEYSARVDLEWDTHSGVDEYRVVAVVNDTDAVHEDSVIPAGLGPRTSRTYLELANGTVYSFTVVAVKGSLETSMPSSVEATPADRSDAGVTLLPINMFVAEGGSRGYTVTLQTKPTENVTIGLSRKGGADPDLTASTEMLTFTKDNWDDPQTVTVSAAPDDDGEAGKTEFLHTVTSNDPGYQGLGIGGVSATEADDDPVGVTVWPQALTVPEGGSRQYTVRLDTQPEGRVWISVTLPTGDKDLTTEPRDLYFYPSNWNMPQTVTVSAAEDADRSDGTATFEHSLSGEDTTYNDADLAIDPVTATEADNDRPLPPRDRTRPRVTITSAAAAPVGGAFAVTIRFSENVSGFSLTDIAVRNGTASDFKRGTSRTYTATITPEASGAVRVAVGADVAEDRAGNGNRPATPLVLAADLKRPTVTIAGPAALVGLTEFAVTITFSEPVVGFEQADLQISNGRVTAFTTASPSAYRATLTPEANGAVTVVVGANVAQDRAGNGNQSAAFVIAADLAGPTVTIAGPTALVGVTEFAVTITFSEPVVGFEQADLQISNGRVTAFTAESPRVYRATLTLAEAGQPVVVEVSADVAEDQAGNGNQPAAFVIAAPYGRFESPADGATVSGIALIWGWTFAEAAGVGIADIVVYIDGQHETIIPCCSLRGDVHAAYPDFPAANTTASGWGLTYNWGNLAAGAHTLQVVATSSQGVRWESAVHTIQVLKPGDVVFADRLSLAPAAVWLEAEELVLDGVVIRDKASQQEQAITAHYGWRTAAQGLRLVATAPVEPAPVATIRAPGRAGVARLLAELGAWGRWLLSPARVTATPGLTAAYEAPADQAVVAGVGLIQGWAFADMGNEIATVTLHIDGAASGPAPCCSERQDVATAYPDEGGALDSGWGLVFNYGNLAAGAHTIGVRITTEAGGAETTEHTVTVVQLGGYAFVDAFDVSGAAVWIEGEEIVLSGVEVRDKATQATQLVEVRLRWSPATQGLTIVGSETVP